MNWDDYQGLGHALHARYPEVNYLTVADGELVRLVTALPDFSAGPVPPDPVSLAAVRFAWVAAAEGDADDGPYDGFT